MDKLQLDNYQVTGTLWSSSNLTVVSWQVHSGQLVDGHWSGGRLVVVKRSVVQWQVGSGQVGSGSSGRWTVVKWQVGNCQVAVGSGQVASGH